jgi:hypothetical protein
MIRVIPLYANPIDENWEKSMDIQGVDEVSVCGASPFLATTPNIPAAEANHNVEADEMLSGSVDDRSSDQRIPAESLKLAGTFSSF